MYGRVKANHHFFSCFTACCAHSVAQQADFDSEYISMTDDTTMVIKSKRPSERDRLFRSNVRDNKIKEDKRLLKDNPYLAWMFENCFPNTFS